MCGKTRQLKYLGKIKRESAHALGKERVESRVQWRNKLMYVYKYTSAIPTFSLSHCFVSVCRGGKRREDKRGLLVDKRGCYYVYNAIIACFLIHAGVTSNMHITDCLRASGVISVTGYFRSLTATLLAKTTVLYI